MQKYYFLCLLRELTSFGCFSFQNIVAVVNFAYNGTYDSCFSAVNSRFERLATKAGTQY